MNFAGRRFAVPTILQMEAVECGSVSLGMVLAYYGKSISREQLRESCSISRDGSKASHILDAARALGLDAHGYKRDMEQLCQLDGPAILFWDFNHFVVFEGCRKDRYYINDPAKGPRVLSKAEFSQSYTGVALIFSPTAAFLPEYKRSQTLTAIRSMLFKEYGTLLYVMVCGVLSASSVVFYSIFFRVFIDDIMVRQQTDWTSILATMMLATALFSLWMRVNIATHLTRLEAKWTLSMSMALFLHMMLLPFSFFQQRYVGDVVHRLMDASNTSEKFVRKFVWGLISVSSSGAVFCVLFSNSLVLTLWCIGGIAFTGVMYWIHNRSLAEIHPIRDIQRARMYNMTSVCMESIASIKAVGAESEFFTKWLATFNRVVESEQRMTAMQYTANTFSDFLLWAVISVVCIVGSQRVSVGEMSIGMLMGYLVLTYFTLIPITRLFQTFSLHQDLQLELERVGDVLQYPVVESSGTIQTPLLGQVDIQALSYGYDKNQPPLISEFSISISPGSRVAIVGSTGSGKTTLARLIAGLYKPWSGKILFDGRDRGEFSSTLFTQGVALVDQDIQLFSGTIKQNITFFDNSISEDDMVAAATDARINDDIMAMPANYERTLAARGQNLSGGQAQRIEIARALATNPAILILDEATSSLDSVSEVELDEHIRRRGCTCIIVAHRLSTIRDSDEIIVLDEGKIVQRGKHEALLKMGGLYQQLIASAN